MNFKDIPDFPETDFEVELPVLKKVIPTKTKKPKETVSHNPEEKKLTDPIKNHVNENSYFWDNSCRPTDCMKLPLSDFSEDSQKEILTIEVPTLLEHCERKSLNPVQLASVWKTGTFEVDSSHVNIKHVWRVSGFLCSGTQQIREMWRHLISLSAFLLLYTRFFIEYPVFTLKLRLNPIAALRQILVFVISLFHMIFGLPIWCLSKTKTQLFETELEKQRSIFLKQKNFPQTFALLQLIKMPICEVEFPRCEKNAKEMTPLGKKWKEMQETVNQNNESVKEVCQQINTDWKNYYDSQVNQIADVDEEEFNELISKINTQKFERELSSLENQNLIEKQVMFQMNQKLKQIRLVEKIFNLKSAELAQKQQKISEKLKSENPVKSRVNFWFDKNFAIQIKGITQEIEAKYEKLIEEELSKLDPTPEGTLYVQSANFTSEFLEKKQQILEKLIKQNRKSAETREIVYLLNPPYEIQAAKDENGQPYYTFVKVKVITVSSTFFFFRMVVDLYRLIYWSKNLSYYSLRYALVGECGLKGLLWCVPYFTDYSIDRYTGQVKQDANEAFPIIHKFTKTMRGILKSREDFENAPDIGFFGKNMARIFNLIECYIIRFLFVGILITLVLHPIFNIFVIVFLFTVSLSSFVWVAISILFNRIWGILFFNFLSKFQYSYISDEQKTSSFEKYVKYHTLFPIIALLWNLLIKGVFAFVLAFVCLIFYPILAILLYVISCLSILLKICWDYFCFNIIIRCLAKIPQKDTNLARRIAGPGISRNLFYSLSMEDSVILIQSLLENIQLQKFEQQLTEIINYPSVKITTLFSRLLKAFVDNPSGQPKSLSPITESIYSLDNELRDKLRQRRELLPRLPYSSIQIKFTESEIQILKRICEEIIKSKLKKLKIEDFVWIHCGIPINKYKLLVAKIIKLATQQDSIFEAIEEADQRIVMEQSDSVLKRKRNVVNNIMLGELLLETFKPVYRKKTTSVNDALLKNTFEVLCNYLRKAVSNPPYQHLFFSIYFEE